jgi:endoglucanase
MLPVGLAFTLFALCSCVATAAPACFWPAWERFKNNLIQEDGRVIDPSLESGATTSEGQSYGLFFALVANDRVTFRNLLRWTEDKLADGDLTAHLPAWLWGKTKENQWKVLDSNSAADADLWIAYTLLEAGRLWQEHAYSSTGTLLLQRIAQEEVADLPHLGLTLLPGKRGFSGDKAWRLNPSYLPLPILARLKTEPGPWQQMVKTTQRMLVETSPKGYAPNWVSWRSAQRWQPDPKYGSTGDYDAIRVYLWTGMLSNKDPAKAALMRHFAPMAAVTASHGAPPETVQTRNGKVSGTGPVGFSAALLPFLAGTPAAQVQRGRLVAHPPDDKAYYNQVLGLFGQGWDEQRFRFDKEGRLQPAWSTCQN